MADTELYTGVCDLCGKDADAAVEDCMNIFCMKQCHRTGGDIYHQDCIKKYIGTASKGSTGRQPKIPYSNFGCPKGKSNKTTAAEPCKGNVLHCKRIIYKNENKPPPPPPPLQVANPPPERKKKEKKAKTAENGAGSSRAAAEAAGDAVGWETVGPKKLPRLPAKPPAPQYRTQPVTKLPPIPQAPKPDPLGRKLSNDKPHELPVGFVPEDDSSNKGAAGKSAKKNQKRAAKRKETGAPSIDASVGEASAQASGWGEGFGSGAGSDAGGSEHNPLMGNTKFITDINAFNKLLAGQFSDSEEEYDEEALAITTEEPDDDDDGGPPLLTPDFTLREGLEWPVVAVAREDEDDGNTEGWQNVLPGGRVSAPAGPANWPSSNDTLVTASAASPVEDEQLRAALEASAATADMAANTSAVADDEYERQLARALAESQRAEEERLQREKAAQAALLAQFEQGRQQQAAQQQYSEHFDSTAWQAGDGVSATPILSYSQVPQSAAASSVTWPPATPPGPPAAAPAAAHPISFPQYPASAMLQSQQNPLQQSFQFQQQHAVVSIQLPPAVAASTPMLLAQQQQLPAPLPFLQQLPQQQVTPLFWPQQQQQKYAGTEAFAAALPQAKFSVATTAAAAVDDDDDTDELLALLAVA